METLEILKERKQEIIDKTISILSNAFSGNSGMFTPNLAFYFKENESEIEIDYYPFVGNQSHSENVFCIVKGHEIPTVMDLGYEDGTDYDEVDWYACGYDERLSCLIDDHIQNLEFENE